MKELKTDVITSLNESVNMELSIQQLENRLETDPLAVSGLLELNSDIAANVECFSISCDEFEIEF